MEDKNTYQPDVNTWRDVWFFLPVEVRINNIPKRISYYIILGKTSFFNTSCDGNIRKTQSALMLHKSLSFF